MGAGGRPLRRAVLIGMGAVGGSALMPALMPWSARVGAQENPRPIPTEPIIPGADATPPQRAVLYEEDAAVSNGQRFSGTVEWSAGREKAGTDVRRPSATTEMVLRARIVIREHGMRLRLAMRRNEDKSLPATHTVDLMFDLPGGFKHQGIQSVPGLLAKNGEHERGVPLAGLAVKVTTDYFLIGLSAVEKESQRNVMLLKERSWLDIPIVYADGRRAILAVEKGERAFGQAFAAWDGATPERKSSPPAPKNTDRVTPPSPDPPDSVKTPLDVPEP